MMNNSTECKNFTPKNPCSISLSIRPESKNVRNYLKLESKNCNKFCDFVTTKVSVGNTVLVETKLSDLLKKEISLTELTVDEQEDVIVEHTLVQDIPNDFQQTSLNLEYYNGQQFTSIKSPEKIEINSPDKINANNAGTVSGTTSVIENTEQKSTINYPRGLFVGILMFSILLFVLFIRLIFLTNKKRF